MSKYQQIAEHIGITFFEAAIAYIIVIPHVTWTRTVIAGAIGAGLSAVYNLLRQSTPTIAPDSLTAAAPAYSAGPGTLNGVSQLTEVGPPLATASNVPTPPETPTV